MGLGCKIARLSALNEELQTACIAEAFDRGRGTSFGGRDEQFVKESSEITR